MTSFNLSITVGSRCVAAACAWTGADGLTVEPVELGVGGTAPSVAFVDPAGELIFGDLALQLARDQPQRAIFDLQERVGDGIALLIGGRRLDPAQLYARLVGWAVDRSADQFGELPAGVTIGHPSEWGEYRLSLIADALASVGIAGFNFMTLPEAAVAQYEASAPLAPGELIAVYDLGGDSFTCTVLRKERDGVLALLGAPGAIRDLGGADFDDLVFQHVWQVSGLASSPTDTSDPAVIESLRQLRDACVAAKEALSDQTAAIITIAVPPMHKTVRLTRSEFEHLIDPALDRTADTLEEMLERAGVKTDALQAIFLTGGTSRIPRVAQRLSELLDRPIVIEADPRLSAAAGAARTGLPLAEERAAALAPAVETAAEADDDDAAPITDTPGRASNTNRLWHRNRGGLMVVIAALVTLLLTGSSAAIFDPAQYTGTGMSSGRPDGSHPSSSVIDDGEDEADDGDDEDHGPGTITVNPDEQTETESGDHSTTNEGQTTVPGTGSVAEEDNAAPPVDNWQTQDRAPSTSATSAIPQPQPQPQPSVVEPTIESPPADPPLDTTNPDPGEPDQGIPSPPESGISP